MRKPIPQCLVALPKLVQLHHTKFGPFWTTIHRTFFLVFTLTIYTYTLKAQSRHLIKTFFRLDFFFKSHKKTGKGPKFSMSFIWNRWPIPPCYRSPFSSQGHSGPTLSPTLPWVVFEQDITLSFPCAWSCLSRLMSLYFYGSFYLFLLNDIYDFENEIQRRAVATLQLPTPELCLWEVWGAGTDSLFQGQRAYFKTCCNSSVTLAEHPSLLSFFLYLH